MTRPMSSARAPYFSEWKRSSQRHATSSLGRACRGIGRLYHIRQSNLRHYRTHPWLSRVRTHQCHASVDNSWDPPKRLRHLIDLSPSAGAFLRSGWRARNARTKGALPVGPPPGKRLLGGRMAEPWGPTPKTRLGSDHLHRNTRGTTDPVPKTFPKTFPFGSGLDSEGGTRCWGSHFLRERSSSVENGMVSGTPRKSCYLRSSQPGGGISISASSAMLPSKSGAMVRSKAFGVSLSADSLRTCQPLVHFLGVGSMARV